MQFIQTKYFIEDLIHTHQKYCFKDTVTTTICFSGVLVHSSFVNNIDNNITTTEDHSKCNFCFQNLHTKQQILFFCDLI